MPVAPAGSKVLVTGASGFIAVHVVHEALKAGYQVVGTVRSSEKGEYLKQLFQKQYPGKFSYTIAEDLEAPGAFDESVKGVQAVLHTASPFHFAAEGKALDALVNPAVNGTLSVLGSIKKHGHEVQRVVITSSYAAILDSSRPAPVEYTEKDWNESSAVNSKRDGNKQDSVDAYRASKTLAEQRQGGESGLNCLNRYLIAEESCTCAVCACDHVGGDQQVRYDCCIVHWIGWADR